jgi:hypothetical protein
MGKKHITNLIDKVKIRKPVQKAKHSSNTARNVAKKLTVLS